MGPFAPLQGGQPARGIAAPWDTGCARVRLRGSDGSRVSQQEAPIPSGSGGVVGFPGSACVEGAGGRGHTASRPRGAVHITPSHHHWARTQNGSVTHKAPAGVSGDKLPALSPTQDQALDLRAELASPATGKICGPGTSHACGLAVILVQSRPGRSFLVPGGRVWLSPPHMLLGHLGGNKQLGPRRVFEGWVLVSQPRSVRVLPKKHAQPHDERARAQPPSLAGRHCYRLCISLLRSTARVQEAQHTSL